MHATGTGLSRCQFCQKIRGRNDIGGGLSGNIVYFHQPPPRMHSFNHINLHNTLYQMCLTIGERTERNARARIVAHLCGCPLSLSSRHGARSHSHATAAHTHTHTGCNPPSSFESLMPARLSLVCISAYNM